MQLGSFKSVLGSFLSQLGFSPWPSGATGPIVPTTPHTSGERRTLIVGRQFRSFTVRSPRQIQDPLQPRRTYIS